MDWKQIGYITANQEYYALTPTPLSSRIKNRVWQDKINKRYFLTKGSAICFTHPNLEVVIMYGVESEV